MKMAPNQRHKLRFAHSFGGFQFDLPAFGWMLFEPLL
jgi:hypothetical protein